MLLALFIVGVEFEFGSGSRDLVLILILGISETASVFVSEFVCGSCLNMDLRNILNSLVFTFKRRCFEGLFSILGFYGNDYVIEGVF